jgi:hypothetical protein
MARLLAIETTAKIARVKIRTRPPIEPMKAGLSREREQQLLSDAPYSAH